MTRIEGRTTFALAPEEVFGPAVGLAGRRLERRVWADMKIHMESNAPLNQAPGSDRSLTEPGPSATGHAGPSTHGRPLLGLQGAAAACLEWIDANPVDRGTRTTTPGP